jgi:hypothetical protein
MFSSHFNYGAEAVGAFLEASGAFDAFFLVDYVNHSLAAADRLDGASPGTDTTASTFIGQYIKVYKRPAYQCRTYFINDMSLPLVLKIANTR